MRRRGGGNTHEDGMPMFGNSDAGLDDHSRRNGGRKGQGNNMLILLVIGIVLVGGGGAWFWFSQRSVPNAAGRYGYDDNENISDDERMKRFMKWFVRKGGKLESDVSVSKFDGYGYGLINKSKSKTIYKGDVLFKVPESIIFSAKNTISSWKNKLGLEEQFINNFVKNIISKTFKPYEQQDAIIALQLMIECSLATASEHYEYLSLLPSSYDDVPPRLDTLNDQELRLLQDNVLETMGKDYHKDLKRGWDKLQKENVIKTVLDTLVVQRSYDDHPPLNIDKCFTFESFHTYMVIVSSHAMLLDSIKYLVPLADMINHESRPAGEDGADEDSDTFDTFHKYERNGNGDETDVITVYADRDVEPASGANNNERHQIFEEYGKLDNSLYLLAHGFIPENNPHHCALISTDYLPTTSTITNENLKHALTLLLDLSDEKYKLESICVKSNGKIVDESADHNRILSYLAVSNLQDDDDESKQHLLEDCVDAVAKYDEENSPDNLDNIRSKCTNYEGKDDAVKRMISKSALKAFNDMETSLQDDLLLEEEYKQLIQKGQNYISKSSEGNDGKISLKHAILAIQFRIADKKILHSISSSV